MRLLRSVFSEHVAFAVVTAEYRGHIVTLDKRGVCEHCSRDSDVN